MKTKGIALLSAAALMAPGLALAAENMPWTYLEAGYIPKTGSEIELGGAGSIDSTFDAGQLTGSIGFLGMGHAQIEYTNGDAASESFDGYRLVIGGHNQIGENTQLIGDLTYFDFSFDNVSIDGGEGGFGGTGDADSDGFGIGVGLRHALSSRMEVSGQIWYVDSNTEFKGDLDGLEQDDNATIFELRGRYNWTPQLSTGLTAFLGGSFFSPGGGDFVRADIRWAFGNSDFSDLK